MPLNASSASHQVTLPLPPNSSASLALPVSPAAPAADNITPPVAVAPPPPPPPSPVQFPLDWLLEYASPAIQYPSIGSVVLIRAA